MFTPISIPYKQPRELKIYEIPVSKKLISLRFVQILTPWMRYLYSTWALTVDCYNLTWVKTIEIPRWCARRN